MFPTIRFTEKEFESGCIEPETMLRALALFKTQGCLLLENSYSPSFIAELKTNFIRRYSRYLKVRDYSDALKLSRGRYQVTVRVEPPFDDPRLYANPLVLPILRLLLGERCTLDSFASVISLPGAEEQQPHRDFPGLFNDDDLDTALPSYAITFYVPLIELNEVTGTTRMWPGSHRVFSEESDNSLPFSDPIAPVGSCLMMDYRLRHCGLANRSTQVRPIMYLVYKRPWWVDSVNYQKQYPIIISKQEYKRIPEEHRKLFPQLGYGTAPPRWKQKFDDSLKSAKVRLRNVRALRYVYRSLVKPRRGGA